MINKKISASVNTENSLSRRDLLKAILSLGVSLPVANALLAHNAHAGTGKLIRRTIPGQNESLPVIGLGSSRTFDIASDAPKMMQLQTIIDHFFTQQGALIDSSPMYGNAEQVLGHLLAKTPQSHRLFAATKVWTDGQAQGKQQMQHSLELWGIKRFDLMQIHNLRDWKLHLKTLNNMKSDGKIRYTGITTSHGRFHRELAEILQNHKLDFVQLSYNILDREVEKRLLPIALDRGMAVIINRPFQRGQLFRMTRQQPLPTWSTELDIHSWAQFFLKYIVSHPAVTCAIPATSKLKHLLDNMGAQFGALPEPAQRIDMQKHLLKLI